MAVVAPIPNASESTDVAANDGRYGEKTVLKSEGRTPSLSTSGSARRRALLPEFVWRPRVPTQPVSELRAPAHPNASGHSRGDRSGTPIRVPVRSPAFAAETS